MNYRDVLNYQPWLKFVNTCQISTRLLDYTKGDTFVVFNMISQNHELHSVNSFRLTGFSLNATLEPEMINSFIYHDFRANELKKFMLDVQSRREFNDLLFKKRNNVFDTRHGMKSIERTLGTKV